ncbi:YhdP family protein [Craterilacuibacter sp.]|uniref:YhdP family protein n=1 Tax=Craterilacuibacter sp. TaxID=2870909 RepID=UPI003F38A877
MKDNSTLPKPVTGKHWCARLGRLPVKKIMVWSARALGIMLALWLSALLLLVLVWQFWLKPSLPQVRDYLTTEASRLIGREVSVRALSTHWDYLLPTVTLSGFAISNPGGKALSLHEITLTPAWSSLWTLSPQFSRIALSGLDLSLIRETDGRIVLNGFDLSQGSGQSDGLLVNWLIAQDAITVTQARLRWQDDLVDALPLLITDASLELTRGLLGHKLALNGKPDGRYLGGFRLNAAWRGDDINAWQQWQGKVSVLARDGAFAWWERYAPKTALLPKGKANFKAELAFSDGHIDSLIAEGQVEQAALAEHAATPLALPRIAGRLNYQREGKHGNRLIADQLFLQTQTGELFNNSRIEADWSDQGGGKLTASQLDLAPLIPILIASGWLPEQPWRAAGLEGRVSRVSASWQGALKKPAAYQLSGQFDDLGWQTFGAFPGVAGGFSGRIALNQVGGQLELAGKGVNIDAPELFSYPWQLKQAGGKLTWARVATGGWLLSLPGFEVTTEDFSGQVAGTLAIRPDGALLSDLSAQLGEVPLAKVVRYLPDSLGKETLRWLQAGLGGGSGHDVKATLKGDLKAFPFPEGKGGSFDLTARLARGVLLFAPDWPAISAINGRLVLKNDGVRIEADDALTQGAMLSQVKVELRDLFYQPAVVEIEGQVRAPLQTMLDYTKASPVNGWLDGFLAQIEASGAAGLGLKISLPLDTPDKTRVDGRLGLRGNPLRFTDLPVPPLDAVSGTLAFNEQGVSTPGLALSVLGQPMRLRADTTAQGLSRFMLDGNADMHRVLAFYLPALSPFALGVSPLDIVFSLQDGQFKGLQADSTLVGTSIQAPAPAHKTALERWPFTLAVPAILPNQGARIDWRIQGHAAGRVQLTADGDLQAASIGVGTPLPAPPAYGVALAVAAAQLDADSWLAALTAPASVKGVSGLPPWPFSFALQTPQLTLSGRDWGLTDLNGRVDRQGVSGKVQNPYFAGRMQYPFAAQALTARLDYLKFPLPEATAAGGLPSSSPSPKMPATHALRIAFEADAVYYRALNLGKLQAMLQHGSGLWQLDKVVLSSVDGVFNISGLDAVDGGRTAIRLAFESGNLGALLTRFGYPGAVLGGSGSLAGALSWPGELTQFDAENISGSLSLDVRDGRFSQFDSQAARLLSVLSLQSVRRLLRLDFASVFDKGFAFDHIKGDVAVINGIFQSNGIQLDSTAAKVLMSGQVSLPADTQSLDITVTPKLSQGVALAAGAALLNPVAGLATLAAETVFGNPFGRLFSFGYHVSGSLSDPQVKRVESPLSYPAGKKPAAPTL